VWDFRSPSPPPLPQGSVLPGQEGTEHRLLASTWSSWTRPLWEPHGCRSLLGDFTLSTPFGESAALGHTERTGMLWAPLSGGKGTTGELPLSCVVLMRALA
jgi:hypothetical protein